MREEGRGIFKVDFFWFWYKKGRHIDLNVNFYCKMGAEIIRRFYW